MQVIEGLPETCKFGDRESYCGVMAREQCTTDTIVNDCCALCNGTVLLIEATTKVSRQCFVLIQYNYEMIIPLPLKANHSTEQHKVKNN